MEQPRTRRKAKCDRDKDYWTIRPGLAAATDDAEGKASSSVSDGAAVSQPPDEFSLPLDLIRDAHALIS